MTAPTVSLDQFHWIGLAIASKRPAEDPVYKQILDLAVALRSQGSVRFPLSTDRYYETLRVPRPHQRMDVAYVMKEMSRNETMLQLDLLSVQEIDRAVAGLVPGAHPRYDVPVFGHGAMHAFGHEQLAAGLRLDVPDDVTIPREKIEFLEQQLGFVAREMVQDQFEWSALSGDPRVLPLSPSIRANHDAARERFGREQANYAKLVHDHNANPRDTGYLVAMKVHIETILAACHDLGVDPDLLPLETDGIGFITSIPTVHVLAELLGHQYRNPQTSWRDGDWADLRTLCQAVPYCDAVAPDRHFANALIASRVAAHYGTMVLSSKEALLGRLQDLA